MDRTGIWIAACGLIAVLAGCSRGPEFAEVEGSVTRGGEPLRNVRVEFWPDTDGPKSTGITDDQGRYVLTSEDGTKPGAVVGSHKVVVKDLSLLGDTFLGRKGENVATLNPKAKQRFSKDYADPVRSGLTKTVTSGQKNVIELEVK